MPAGGRDSLRRKAAVARELAFMEEAASERDLGGGYRIVFRIGAVKIETQGQPWPCGVQGHRGEGGCGDPPGLTSGACFGEEVLQGPDRAGMRAFREPYEAATRVDG